MQRLDWSLSRLVTQDIKTQPQINHYKLQRVVGWVEWSIMEGYNLFIYRIICLYGLCFVSSFSSYRPLVFPHSLVKGIRQETAPSSLGGSVRRLFVPSPLTPRSLARQVFPRVFNILTQQKDQTTPSFTIPIATLVHGPRAEEQRPRGRETGKTWMVWSFLTLLYPLAL